MSSLTPPTEAQIKEWKDKAEKWDKLEKKIASCYFDEEGNERGEEYGLDVIGEHAAAAFGYL